VGYTQNLAKQESISEASTVVHYTTQESQEWKATAQFRLETFQIRQESGLVGIITANH